LREVIFGSSWGIGRFGASDVNGWVAHISAESISGAVGPIAEKTNWVPHFSRPLREVGSSAVGSGGFGFHAAGGRIFISRTCQSFTTTGPASPKA
jgi:hypothetical protein